MNLIHVENVFVNSMILSFSSIVVLLQKRSRLTLNQKFESWRRVFESNINVSNSAKNFFAKIDWSILIWFLSISDSTNLYSFKYAWIRFSSIENSLLYVASNLSTRECWDVFCCARSIASERFLVYWYENRISWSYIYVESRHEKCRIRSRFGIVYEIDIMSYCMKIRKIKMILFDFVLFETWMTKDFLVRVESKKNVIKIIQCRVIVRFILSDENEVYQNSNKIHRMKSFFDHQKNNDRNDLSNDDFLFFFRSLLDFEEFLKNLQIDKRRNLSKSNV